MSLSNMSNREIVRLAKSGTFTMLEIELADRLQSAIEEINTLVALIKDPPPTAEEAHGADTRR